jgi:hypothetical protein
LEPGVDTSLHMTLFGLRIDFLCNDKTKALRCAAAVAGHAAAFRYTVKPTRGRALAGPEGLAVDETEIVVEARGVTTAQKWKRLVKRWLSAPVVVPGLRILQCIAD